MSTCIIEIKKNLIKWKIPIADGSDLKERTKLTVETSFSGILDTFKSAYRRG